MAPVVTCVDGRYEPMKPSLFSCQPAVALILTTKGEMELFSAEEKYSRKLDNLPLQAADNQASKVILRQDKQIKKCKMTNQCKAKNGICYTKGKQPQFGYEKRGWCNSKTKCACYVLVDPINPVTPNTTSFSFSLSGHSMDLLSNKIIVGSLASPGSSWRYLSMEDPRAGLLALRGGITATLGFQPPSFHSTFVYGTDLVFMAGQTKTDMILQNGRSESAEWNSLQLLYKDGAAFKGSHIQTCSVKVSRNMFYVVGGADPKSGKAESLVFLVDMEEQSVQTRPPLARPRAAHGCALAKESIYDDQTGKMNHKLYLLISGGVANLKTPTTNIVHDELYDVESGSSQVLDGSLATPRQGVRTCGCASPYICVLPWK